MKKIIAFFTALYSINAFAYYTENIPSQCGILGHQFVAVFTPSVYNCDAGKYLPANSETCVDCLLGHTCPGGSYPFNQYEDQGIVYTLYTCQEGYYLPANSEVCELCPEDYTCPGGSFLFNENEYSGATKSSEYITHNLTNMCATNAPHNFVVRFTPNIHVCGLGYYLPANVDTCTTCLANHYCPGGVYSFNESVVQGMTACPTEHPYAPAGMWEANQCGRKMHLGNDVIYLHQSPANPTEHRFFTGYNNGTNYSANMVLRDTSSSTFPKMSAGAANGLHVTINGAEYLVCDDSVPECRNEQ